MTTSYGPRRGRPVLAILVTLIGLALIELAVLFVITPAFDHDTATFVSMCFGLVVGVPLGKIAYSLWHWG